MFLAIATVPLLLVSALTFTNYKYSLEANRFSQLRDLTIFRADRIEAYFDGLKGHIEIAQGFYNIKRNLPVLTRLADDPNNTEFVTAKKMLDNQLQQMQSVSNFTDIMLLNPQGKVVYAIKPGHYSKDMSNGVDAEQKAFAEGKSRVYFSDVYFDKVEDNRFEMLLTAPAYDFNGAFIGVIAFEVDMTPVYKLIQDANGLGNTGEVLVARKIGNQVEYLNPLRHDPDATLKRRIDIGGEIGQPMQKAVQGKTGTSQDFDYRGKKVIAAWRYIPSLDWGLVAKIDTEEAFADVTNLRNLAAIILVIVIVLSSIMAFSIAHSISEPIKRLSEGAAIIGSGNLDYKIGTNLKDEIGQLSRSFDKMTLDLKQTTASRDELNREIEERKKAEEALRESKNDLDRAQAVAHSGSWRLDIRQNKLTWSDEAYRIFGVPMGTGLTYEMFLTYIHPDDRQYVDTKWKAALAGDKYDIEHRIVVNSQIKWVRERAELEFEQDGTLLGGFGTVTDITQRKQAEEEIRRAATRFEILSDTASKLLESKNPQQIINSLCSRVMEYLDCHIFVNYLVDEQAHRLHLNTTGGLPEKMARDIEWLDFGQAICGRVAQEGKRIVAENIQESCDARADLVRSVGIKAYACHPILSQGKVIGTLSFGTKSRKNFNDDDLATMKTVTDQVAAAMERMLAEEAIRRSRDELEIRVKERTADLDEAVSDLQKQVESRIRAEEAFRSASLYARGLLEASLDPLVTISPEGKITDVNRATEAVTGISRERLIGSDFSNYFTEPQKANEGYKKVIAEGKVIDYPLTIRHTSGHTTDVVYNATVYKNEAGQIQGVFAAARDITEKKATEAELEKYRLHLEDLVKSRTEELVRSNKDLEQFAYVASHDLQEPLRAVSGFVELLRRNLEKHLDAQTNEYMNFAIDGAKRMQALISGLLEYSRIGTQGKKPNKTDSKEALDEAIARLATSIKESGAEINVDGLPVVYFDDVQLSQLFQNLIGNAIKFRGDQPLKIHINATHQDAGPERGGLRHWQFAVADNGIGIEPQYAERIFQIFQRLHTRGKYPGTGIGLSICKKIVERHNGKIWVESEPGNGSTFYFTIPDTGET
jgi:PAS domain S-box-containing protein